MKKLVTNLIILAVIAVNISSCSKQEILCNDFLRGQWVLRDWAEGNNGSGDLIYTYDGEKNEMILSVVPVNSFGFEVGEVSIKDIDVNNDESFTAMVKLRSGNGDFEWIGLEMMVENDNLIKTKADCDTCNTFSDLERI